MFSFPRNQVGPYNRVSDMRSEPVVQYFNDQNQALLWGSNHCGDFPVDLWYPIGYAWQRLKDVDTSLGTVVASSISAALTPYCARRVNELHGTMQDILEALNNHTRNVALTIVHTRKDTEGGVNAEVERLKEKGWKSKPRLATLLTLNKRCSVQVLHYQYAERSLTLDSYLIVTNSNSMQTYPRIAALVPSFVAMELPRIAQTLLLQWTNYMDEEGSDNTEFTHYLQEQPFIKEYIIARKEKVLADLLVQLAEKELKVLKDQYERANKNMQDAIKAYEDALGLKRKAEDALFVASINESTYSKNLAEGLEYLRNHSCVDDIYVTKDSELWLRIITPFTNFEDSAARAVIRRRYEETSELAQMWTHLLDQDRYQLILTADLRLPLNHSLNATLASNYDACPNYHLVTFLCFGDNAPAISRFARENNLVALTDILVAATANINFRDPTVLRYFEDYVRGEREANTHGIYDSQTGERLTVKEWRDRLFPKAAPVFITVPDEDEEETEAAPGLFFVPDNEPETETEEPPIELEEGPRFTARVRAAQEAEREVDNEANPNQ